MPDIDASPGLVEDLVDANHILFHQGIVDAFGHVSVRNDRDPGRFLLARNMAPAQVTAADVVEYEVASGEAVAPDAPRPYLERFIHSEIYRARPDVVAVVHNHSPAVLPFGIVKGARLRPACHMCGFLGEGPPLFEIRDHAGDATDLLIRSRELGAALARTLGAARVVLMRGHGCTVVADSLRLAVYRAVYTEVNARLLLQSLPLGEVEYLTPEEADAGHTTEGQVDRPWNLWRAQARAARQA
ncbi:class II aldolase/adducin family protein [Azohydromonas aeria]|uniref:class II aldolase/adducin family protein n=1 Tax=Azohydromonas aeria TaxID=2590212 RepID=UPI0012F9055F|nr:class II aldolase/adducin family protein [Azohydromonas aeria]